MLDFLLGTAALIVIAFALPSIITLSLFFFAVVFAAIVVVYTSIVERKEKIKKFLKWGAISIFGLMFLIRLIQEIF